MINDSFIYETTSPELLFINHTLHKISLSLVLCIFSYIIDCNLQLYVPIIVADPVEGHVSVQGCVDVTLAIQDYTVWMVSLHTHTHTHTSEICRLPIVYPCVVFLAIREDGVQIFATIRIFAKVVFCDLECCLFSLYKL